jgi:endonuclease YncB( thermonuclease family)
MRPHSPLDGLLRLLMGASLVLGLGLPAISFANGTLKPHDGCAVVLVVDGDTVKMLCPREGIVTARLLGLDTPEIFSPRCLGEFGKGVGATARLTLSLLAAAHIAETGARTDRYDRRLVTLRLDGADIAPGMIAAGLARPYGGGRREGWCA